MLWRQKIRDKPPKIRREWRCDECDHSWNTIHEDGEESHSYVPECPNCPILQMRERRAAQQVFRPVAVLGTASKALAVAETMMREDYGMTNMRDHTHEGDIAPIAPSPINTAEADAITREIINAGGVPEASAPHVKAQVQSFWGAGQAAAPAIPAAPALMPQATVAARQARNEGADPIAMLHAGRAASPKHDPLANLRVVSKSAMT